MSIIDETRDYQPLDKYLAVAATTSDSMSLPKQVLEGAVATVADVGTTFWNSLTPEKYNASTADLLSRIDQDALQVYNEHPDAIHTASFLAGMALPIGLSVKGMNMLRAGSKGFSWFSEAGQASRLAAVESAFANAGRDATYEAAKWAVYRGIAYNAVADNVAMEAAIVGTMSAHPYMEDYYKDFSSNFLKSVAFGTLIQTPIASIISKSQISKAEGVLEKQVTSNVKELLLDPLKEAGISQRSHLGELAAIHIQGVERLEALVESQKLAPTISPYSIKVIEGIAEIERAGIVSKIEEAARGDLQKFLGIASEDQIRYITNFVADARNAGLDKIGFVDVAGATKGLGETVASGQLKPTKSLFETIVQKVKGTSQEVEKTVKTDAIYLPWADSYISKAEAPYYLTVADFGQSVEELGKRLGKDFGLYPRSDWGIEMSALPTAELDRDFASALLHVKDKDLKWINSRAVSPEDLPLLKALHVRVQEILRTDPTAVVSLRITKEAPSWDAVQRSTLAVKGGVPYDYISKLQNLRDNWDPFVLTHYNKAKEADVPDKTFNALRSWIGGNTRFLRRGAVDFRGMSPDTIRAITDPTARREVQEASDLVRSIYNSPRSVAMRAELSKLADIDGNIWLYRGMRASPKGHQPIESYALLPEKAKEFGDVKMYKVHVDDIMGTVKDFGPSGPEPEILAFPPTRDYHAIASTNLRTLPDELTIKAPTVVNVTNTQTAVLANAADLEKTMIEAQTQAIKDLVAKNFGIETIALKTGTPVDTIKKILEDNQVIEAGLIKYSSKEDIEKVLGFQNRALALSTDPKKLLQPEIFAQLNAKNLDSTSSGLIELYLLSSQSELVQKFGAALLSPDIKALTSALYDQVAKITGAELKSSMLASTNQVLSALGPVGTIINTIGKETASIKREISELFEKPIANLMDQVIKAGEATLIENNTALAVNASIKGRRFYKDGAFWIPSDKVDLRTVRAIIKLKDEEWRMALEQAEEGLFTKAQFAGKDFNIVSPAVRELHSRLQDYGREMYEFTNSRLKAIGKQELSDIGYWTPSFNPRNKAIAYVHNLIDDTTSMLYADSDELLRTGRKAYEDELFKKYGKDWGAQFRIVGKDQQEAFNKLRGRHDPLYMQAADLSMQHGGSSTPTIVSTDTSMFKDILQGYQEQVNRGVEGILEIRMSQTMDMLKTLSDISNKGHSDSTYGVIKSLISKPVDTGQTIRNILLARPLLGEHKAWSELQQRGQVYTDLALKTITEIFQPILAPLISRTSSFRTRTPEEWASVVKEMDAKGIVNPFESLDKTFGLNRYLQEGKSGTEGLTARTIALGNGLAASFLLRVADLAQPFVNAISLPILTSGAVTKKLSQSFMGSTLDPQAKFALAETMYNGWRLGNHPIEGVKWSKIGETKGLFDVEVRNVTEMMAHQRNLDPGIVTSLEAGMESSLMKMLSKPADISEEFVRRQSFFTGVYMAKKAYPGLSDAGVTAFARNFMDEAVGNYTAAQRPAFFQGTFGMAMGLFQTYMLTLAQNMYRQVEHRDWKSLGKMLLTQTTIFGSSSLPGFHQVSEAIGNNFSDQHYDLESGTFRAVGDPVASMLLYGLPSSFGPGVSTRGDIQPRLPNPFQGVQSLALVNLGTQVYQGLERVATAAFSANENTGRAMLEAISLQSISRPMARLSELAVGTAITSRGDLVADSSEIYTTQGIISRLMATRPLEEIKAREALHLNSVYGSADHDKRSQVVSKLKSYIRHGTDTPDAVDQLAERYLRTGTAPGWRAAINEAVKQEAQGGQATTLSKLKKDSPLSLMIEDTEKGI